MWLRIGRVFFSQLNHGEENAQLLLFLACGRFEVSYPVACFCGSPPFFDALIIVRIVVPIWQRQAKTKDHMKHVQSFQAFMLNHSKTGQIT